MSGIAVLGAGAFGTSLALALAGDGSDVILWGRSAEDVAAMNTRRMTGRALPDHPLPPSLQVTTEIPDAAIALIAVPAQSVSGFLSDHREALTGKTLISCAKGIEHGTGRGPVEVIRAAMPEARAGCY